MHGTTSWCPLTPPWHPCPLCVYVCESGERLAQQYAEAEQQPLGMSQVQKRMAKRKAYMTEVGQVRAQGVGGGHFLPPATADRFSLCCCYWLPNPYSRLSAVTHTSLTSCLPLLSPHLLEYLVRGMLTLDMAIGRRRREGERKEGRGGEEGDV